MVRKNLFISTIMFEAAFSSAVFAILTTITNHTAAIATALLVATFFWSITGFGYFFGSFPPGVRILTGFTARRMFNEIFGFYPPKKKDWVAMRAYQKFVTQILVSRKKNLKAICDQENQELLKVDLLDRVPEFIENHRQLHEKVITAKQIYLNALWLAAFFFFDVNTKEG